MSDHDVARAEDATARGAPAIPEPLPPGCMGLIFAGIAAVGSIVLFRLWMEASTYPGVFGSAIADVVIIGVGIVVVPIVSLVVFFVGRGYGHRRRMNLLMASLSEDDEHDDG